MKNHKCHFKMKPKEKSVHTEIQEMALNHQMCQTWASQIDSVVPNQWNWSDVRHADWSDIKVNFGSEQSYNFSFEFLVLICVEP